MTTFLGNDPIGKYLEETCRLSDGRSFPLDDQSLVAEGSVWCKSGEKGPQIILDRGSFKEFCLKNGIESPKGKQIDSFEELSKFVLSRQKFPLALKTRKNRSGGIGTFRLEGFKEISRFYDRVHSIDPGPKWIEDWIPFDALVEITRGPGDFTLVAQVSLEKRLVVRHQWRQFPVRLSNRLEARIKKLLDPFDVFGWYDQSLIRFTIGIMGGEPILISLNAGWNRLEYFPGWCEAAGVNPAWLNIIGSARPLDKKEKIIGRIQLFYRSAKEEPWPAALPSETRPLPIAAYLPAGRWAAALLIGSDLRQLDLSARNLLHILSIQ